MKKIIVGMLMLASALHAETLQEAMECAYQNNAELQAKLHDQLGTQEHAAQAFSGFLPTVTAGASAGVTRKSAREATPRRSETTDQKVEVSVKQNLFRGLGDAAQVRASRHEIDAGYYDYQHTEQEVILGAVSAYASVFSAQKALEFNTENEKFLSKQLKAVTLAREAGAKTSVDVSQAKAALAEARANLIQAKGELANAQANYRNVVGHHPGVLAYPKSLPQAPTSLEIFLAAVKQKNPKIRQAQHASRQAHHSIGVQRANLLPSLDLEGKLAHEGNNHSHGADADASVTTHANTGSLHLTLSVPLYNGGAHMAGMRRASHKAVSARFQLEQAFRNVVEESTKAWDNLLIAQESIEHRQAQVDFSKMSRDGAFLSYEVGETSSLDALDAQNKWLEAQKGLEEARKNLVILRYTLLSLMGELTHRDAQLNVTSYVVQEPRARQTTPDQTAAGTQTPHVERKI